MWLTLCRRLGFLLHWLTLISSIQHLHTQIPSAVHQRKNQPLFPLLFRILFCWTQGVLVMANHQDSKQQWFPSVGLHLFEWKPFNSSISVRTWNSWAPYFFSYGIRDSIYILCNPRIELFLLCKYLGFNVSCTTTSVDWLVLYRPLSPISIIPKKEGQAPLMTLWEALCTAKPPALRAPNLPTNHPIQPDSMLSLHVLCQLPGTVLNAPVPLRVFCGTSLWINAQPTLHACQTPIESPSSIQPFFNQRKESSTQLCSQSECAWSH